MHSYEKICKFYLIFSTIMPRFLFHPSPISIILLPGSINRCGLINIPLISKLFHMVNHFITSTIHFPHFPTPQDFSEDPKFPLIPYFLFPNIIKIYINNGHPLLLMEKNYRFVPNILILGTLSKMKFSFSHFPPLQQYSRPTVVQENLI